MTQLLMCDPNHFGVDYVINPWMEHQVGAVSNARARHQWHALHQVLSSLADVVTMPSAPDWPDLVFTANAGLILPGTRQVVLATFKHPERQGEQALNRAWFEAAGWECLVLPSGIAFEGAGDALIDTAGRLFVGEGPRSDKAALPALRRLTAQAYGLTLADPRYYHLDTCFCPLSRGYALAVLPAFDMLSRQLLDYFFQEKLISLTEDEAALFCANAVCLGDTVVMNTCPPRLRDVLGKHGFAVIESPLSEFMKSGGSAKCLTLRLAD